MEGREVMSRSDTLQCKGNEMTPGSIMEHFYKQYVVGWSNDSAVSTSHLLLFQRMKVDSQHPHGRSVPGYLTFSSDFHRGQTHM